MRLFLLLFLSSLFVKVDFASSETLIVRLPKGINEARVDLRPEQKVTKIIFHKVSPGNELTGFRGGVFSNVKGVARLFGTKIPPRRKPKDRQLISKRNWISKSVRLSSGGTTSKIKIGESNAGGGSSEPLDPFCACYNENQINYFIAIIRAMYGSNITRAEVCEYLMEGRQGPLTCNDPGQGGGGFSSVNFKGILEKDTCSRDEMLVKIEVSLRGVSEAERVRGVSVSAYFDENEFKGRKSSSIKPEGEGKFKEPLALMSPIYGGQIKFYKWNGFRKERTQGLPTDYVIWRIPLIRAPAGRLMRGGRGVFAVVSEDTGYSICANLTATRQYFNGYPR